MKCINVNLWFTHISILIRKNKLQVRRLESCIWINIVRPWELPPMNKDQNPFFRDSGRKPNSIKNPFWHHHQKMMNNSMRVNIWTIVVAVISTILRLNCLTISCVFRLKSKTETETEHHHDHIHYLLYYPKLYL